MRADRIWLATGSRVNLADEQVLDPVLAAHPGATVEGLPILDRHLRWQGCELFIMGGLIVPALTKASFCISSPRRIEPHSHWIQSVRIRGEESGSRIRRSQKNILWQGWYESHTP